MSSQKAPGVRGLCVCAGNHLEKNKADCDDETSRGDRCPSPFGPTMSLRPSPPPDWQLPPGVSRGLWDYLHDPAIAHNYDAGLASSSLFGADVAFVERHCPLGWRLIDLGCGTGRLLMSFARRGHFVLGVDLSAEMLTVAREKATV